MDGATLTYQVRNLLNEGSDSGFLDARTTYDFLYQAAIELNARLRFLTSSQSISTVAEQADYALNADFQELYLKTDSNELYVKYYDGATNHFPVWEDHQEIIVADSSSVLIPTFFCVRDKPIYSRITGSATSSGASSGGESTLTDTGADFSNVSAGDWAHNTTDGSTGIVLSKTSGTVLTVALFGGTNNDWTNADSYVIQPQGRFQLTLEPPPSTSAHTMTVYYIQKPAPVYSDYGIYRFPSQYQFALVNFAAWLYKYRDREPNFGDKWYQFFDTMVRKSRAGVNNALNRKRWTMNLKKSG